MIVLCLIVAIGTFALFGLSTDQHHQQRLGAKLTAPRRKTLRSGAWAGVALCFLLAFVAEGAIYGAIFWLGALSFGAAVVFLFLNLAPTSADTSRRVK
ncbi:DUF3325 domain-containing protein [Novosphingobium sp. fls2-241-R2A-195]|jgi:hypothetical protein|uniref:DUF3325 domain-containing protein n=1 Tax=Novosphingobium sp. fls2-241-R2A-195 TaxID=3040296 RepID=UPI00254D8736|nr:DUF3325 domain-containing protein [Novosphingobium sp. fls2-241-R2A-195]